MNCIIELNYPSFLTHMTDSMSEDYNKEQDSQLAKAIEECKKVAASSSKEAKENVAFIKDSIEKANKELAEVKYDYKC